MEDKNLALLESMYNSIVKCLNVAKDFTSAEDLNNNKLVLDFIISNLVIVYEADNKLDKHIKAANSFVDWEKIQQLRQEVLSDYHVFDYKLIWKILNNELPLLKEKLDKIL